MRSLAWETVIAWAAGLLLGELSDRPASADCSGGLAGCVGSARPGAALEPLHKLLEPRRGGRPKLKGSWGMRHGGVTDAAGQVLDAAGVGPFVGASHGGPVTASHP